MNHQNSPSETILNQLTKVIVQLNDEQFTAPIPLLSGNSIGKHIRHIIEFYECLISGYPSGVIDYDSRARNMMIESHSSVAINSIELLIKIIEITSDKPLVLLTQFSGSENSSASTTSFHRELVYNLEHTVHHMAIIKIAIVAFFPLVNLPDNFGVAYSTVQYLKQ